MSDRAHHYGVPPPSAANTVPDVALAGSTQWSRAAQPLFQVAPEVAGAPAASYSRRQTINAASAESASHTLPSMISVKDPPSAVRHRRMNGASRHDLQSEPCWPCFCSLFVGFGIGLQGTVAQTQTRARATYRTRAPKRDMKVWMPEVTGQRGQNDNGDCPT